MKTLGILDSYKRCNFNFVKLTLKKKNVLELDIEIGFESNFYLFRTLCQQGRKYFTESRIIRRKLSRSFVQRIKDSFELLIRMSSAMKARLVVRQCLIMEEIAYVIDNTKKQLRSNLFHHTHQFKKITVTVLFLIQHKLVMCNPILLRAQYSILNKTEL